MDDTQTMLLVAERGEPTRTFLLENLATDGYEPLGARSEGETCLKLRNHGPALLVLGGSRRTAGGLRRRAIRAGEAGGDPALPVILLDERAGELELLRALEAGCATSWRSRSPTPSCARVRTCIWRAQQGRVPRRLVVGALVIDRDARKARHGGQELWLQPRMTRQSGMKPASARASERRPDRKSQATNAP